MKPDVSSPPIPAVAERAGDGAAAGEGHHLLVAGRPARAVPRSEGGAGGTPDLDPDQGHPPQL